MVKTCLLYTVVSGLLEVHVSSSVSDSCPISRVTVENVESCPVSKEEWRNASARKNCAAYVSKCNQPERLVYHCVINAYVDKLIEVCAYPQNIVLGHCAEYNNGGNLIQANSKTNCTTFAKQPCSKWYRSTEAYKYPGCYELTGKMNKITVQGEPFLNKHVSTPVNETKKINNAMNNAVSGLRKKIYFMYMSLFAILIWKLNLLLV